jgi:excisionase family DNA binding protein
MSNESNGLALTVPPDLVQAIAERTAELLAEQLPNRPEPYLDVDGAAAYLSAPVSRIYDLRRQGVRHYKDGTRLLFKREDLDAWLDAE